MGTRAESGKLRSRKERARKNLMPRGASRGGSPTESRVWPERKRSSAQVRDFYPFAAQGRQLLSGMLSFSEIAAGLPEQAVTRIEGVPYPRVASGKVREIFDLGDALLLTATDRLSAFDVILPDGIPGKGIVLTQLSNWWFGQTESLIP